MATAALTPSDLKTLDATRQRLAQLTTALTSLQTNLLNANNNPSLAPSYTSLHSQSMILAQILTSLAAHLHTHSSTLLSATGTENEVGGGAVEAGTTATSGQGGGPGQSTGGKLNFAATSIFPLPAFPGREEEGLLGQLLRKKLEVGVAEWVDEGKADGEELLATTTSSHGAGDEAVTNDGDGVKAAQDWKELWEWAGVEANGVARGYDWGGEFDLSSDDEEEGKEDDEDEDEEGDQVMENGDGVKKTASSEGEGGGKPMDVGDLMRFMIRGEIGSR